jgi:hypothetical protein
MRVSTRSVAGAFALMAVGFAGGTLVRGDAAKPITQWTQADLKWSAVPGMPIMGAPAWSSPSGAYCQFAKFPKGTKIPLHHHTSDVSAVVISGHFGSAEPGTTLKPLGPGSYQSIPAGNVHTTECSAAADCVIYSCGPSAFDLIEEKPAK